MKDDGKTAQGQEHRAQELSDLEMTKLCALALEFPDRCIYQIGDETHIEVATGSFQFDPLHDDVQMMALAKQFPFIASDVFSAVAIAAHDGEPIDANALLVECVAKKWRANGPKSTGTLPTSIEAK